MEPSSQMSTYLSYQIPQGIDKSIVIPYYWSMKRDKLITKIDATLEEYYDNGWNDGHAAGYSDGVDDGVMAHKEMIRNRLNMYLETCMNTNKMREAQFTKEMLEYLMWEYDPVEAERKIREEEENSDGFGIIF